MDTHQSYDPAHFEPLFAVEDRHFWFRARNRILATVMRQITAALAPGYRVLEVGCGTGYVLSMLSGICSQGSVIGMDLFAEGLRYARRRTACALVQGDLNASPLRQRFEVVGLFDVLEHLPDDVGVLRLLHEHLAPAGRLVLTVPACPSLWSYFDEASQHCRRYTLDELGHKLRQAGFQIDYATYFMFSLFPILWLGRKLSGTSRNGGGGSATGTAELAHRELRVMPVINEVLHFLLAQEAHLIARRVQLPMGTSILALAKRIPASHE
ncbi:MAG: class I SAM-dependent methyltransferase [candidate division KSB1 bacterium]|nr:class I SAM-dependent methyltransferase [candidate division KSB1 bacterium]MDZ7276111.1 class I SAM-dependent methyltransferase [candidate division KSB1 bacterium]MDZ7287109.1 class I SAM-dependent methyltransferase [candidate division KSB1 bacterium]MDZ7296966.1 class I SAM-dependent methyltransferase [candidate division KSB1 bacterium]MDZ7306205.1 class I SAM-dependent methyltransferase [candidate division KSB1 bacterium]